MAEKIIVLSRPIDFGTGSPAITQLNLREMDAGDYFDAGAAIRENASRAELEAHVAAICADVPMAVIRKLRPADMIKVSAWYDSQWKDENAGDGTDPLKAGAVKPLS